MKKLGLVSECLRSKFIKFSSQNLENGRKDRNGRRWITFKFDNENRFSDIFC